MELSDIIQSIDIVEYISQFVDLKQRGEEWWGLSCFKNENTPSFSVRKDPPFFYDYSSGISGNLYSFVKHYYRCSNKEAAEIIKKYAGYNGDVTTVGTDKLSAVAVCMKFKSNHRCNKHSNGVILPDDYMERYEDRTDKLMIWKKEGISDSALKKFSVKYDSFSDRIVYPIRDDRGQIVNIGGRTVTPQWKSKGLRKYTYFFGWGNGINTIYGIFENEKSIVQHDEIIIFEGCKSVLIADTWGINNTGAILTSHLSSNQLKKIVGLKCKNIVFALDKDIDIRKDKNIQRLRYYKNVYFLHDTNSLLDEKDSPVDKGVKVFKQLYDTRNKF